MSVVASDVEGTLTGGETWRALAAWLQVHGCGAAYRAFRRSRMLAYFGTKLGLVNKLSFQNRWIAELPSLFAGMSESEFATVAEWVVEHQLWPKRKAAVVQALSQHRQAGARLVLVSGTYQPILEAFALRLGAEAMGTPLELHDARLTGRLAAPINVGVRKVERLKRAGFESLLAAYGDTMPDALMLELAEHPVVIPSDPQLERLAVQRGWQILRA